MKRVPLLVQLPKQVIKKISFLHVSFLSFIFHPISVMCSFFVLYWSILEVTKKCIYWWVAIPQGHVQHHVSTFNKVKPCSAVLLLDWVTKYEYPVNTLSFRFFFLFPSISKTISETAELPVLCKILMFFLLFINFLLMSICHTHIYMYVYLKCINTRWNAFFEFSILSSVDCLTFYHSLNHLKIHTANQFCDFQHLLFYDLSYMTSFYQ